MGDFQALLAGVLCRINVAAGPIDERPLPCGAFPFAVEGVPTRLYCDGRNHALATTEREMVSAGRCPIAKAEDVRARLAAERERLGSLLDRMRRESAGDGWEGFDRSERTSALAYDVMQRFAAGRPPERGVYLRGGTGRGKTRLMLAAYFDMLAAGVNARFVTPVQLRRTFEQTRSDDDGIRVAANATIDNLRRAVVVFLDDVGIAGDQRFIGDFRERLYEVLETSRAVWAVSTNLDGDELERNPDVGPQTLSRLVRGADVVLMESRDFRTASATVLEPVAQRGLPR